MTDHPTLNNHLLNFGLSDSEAKIYLYLLGKQPKTVLEIARGLNLPRTNVYNGTQRLINKGLLTRVAGSKTHKLKAYDVSILQELVNKQKNKVKKLSDSANYLEKNLPGNLGFLMDTNTEVRYYNGKEGFQQMQWNWLKAEKEMIGYSTYGMVDIVGVAFMKRFVEEFNLRKLRDRVIINPTKATLATIKKDVRPGVHQNKISDIRYLDKSEVHISGNTAVFNNIFSVAYWQEGEVVGIEIENPELVKMQRSIFEMLYEQAKPIGGLLKDMKSNPKDPSH